MRYRVLFYLVSAFPSKWMDNRGGLRVVDLNEAYSLLDQWVSIDYTNYPSDHFMVVEETTDITMLPKPNSIGEKQ